MKKILILLLFFVSIGAYAQTDREILLKLSEKVDKLADKVDKLAEQQIEMSKQIAVINTKIEGIDKRFEAVDKRFDDANRRMDMLFYIIMAVLSAIFGLIGFVVWDRQASIKPILEENKALKKEIEQLTQRELRHEEAVAKSFKRILEKFPDLAGIA